MSFQHFRLQPIAPQPSADGSPSGHAAASTSLIQTFSHSPGADSHGPTNGSKKGPYGSGDADDGYTLVFESMAAFQTWREHEEEEKMVEFVKGDTHGSKAVPPRFKDHTKLVCARHSRSGRKKYVKKYPDRVRKVPSRKLEGIGCPASISYKTYFDTDEIRACYISEHSHEIGPANLPFTKRGRKAQAEAAVRGKKQGGRAADASPSSATHGSDSPTNASANAVAGPSSAPNQDSVPLQPAPRPHPTPASFQSAISMIAPLPQLQAPQPSVDLSQDRWDRMGVLFGSIRNHARSFEYPHASVAALESVLIRLYLESPPVMGVPPNGSMDPMEGISTNGVHGGQMGT